ncbi:hypothetical protein EDC01DRAFT_655438 [Geopyxis carbonaria]|nr:hypothetical protein EDC01DRAFT_655438 [Geopyxis carbonaria]
MRNVRLLYLLSYACVITVVKIIQGTTDHFYIFVCCRASIYCIFLPPNLVVFWLLEISTPYFNWPLLLLLPFVLTVIFRGTIIQGTNHMYTGRRGVRRASYAGLLVRIRYANHIKWPLELRGRPEVGV